PPPRREREIRVAARADHLAPELECAAVRQQLMLNSPADAVAGLEHEHIRAGPFEIPRRRQSGEAGAQNEDVMLGHDVQSYNIAVPKDGGGTHMEQNSRSAIVTGAGSGIGRATALRLAEGGYAIALVGRRAEPLTEVADQIAATGGRSVVIPADV